MKPKSNQSWLYRSVLCLVLVFLSLTIFTSCSKNPVTSSDLTDNTQSTLALLNESFTENSPSRAAAINFANATILYDTTIVQLVNQWGYQMNAIHGAEIVGFSLPYMAVSKPTTLTIHVTEYRASFGKFWLLDCGPEGQTFKYPLYVQANAAARSGSSLVLFYYNPVTKQWEVTEKAKVNSGSNPQVPIYHFSKYAIS
jgi:hypothetical protein